MKNLVHRVTAGFVLRPAGELFGQRVQQRHARAGIGGDHGVADGVERHGQPFLAGLQSDVGLLQLFVRRHLGVEQMLALRFGLFARGIVGADQQVADDGVLRVAQRRDRHHCRETAAVLADVGQLVDVFDAARGLEHQGLEAGRDRGAEFDAQGLGARDHFLRIGDLGRGDLVHDVGRRVAQHALGADVEDLDHAPGVGGDAGEIGAVENRVLQGAGLEQSLLAQHFGEAIGLTGLIDNGGDISSF